MIRPLTKEEPTGLLFRCSFENCACSFDSAQKLGLHRSVHDLERKHVCKECKFRFRTISDLRRHRQQHVKQRKKFKCDYPGCKAAYTRKVNLKEHKHVVHEGKIDDYRCPILGCNKLFQSKDALRHHKKRPHGKRKFNCQYPGCARTFALHKTLLEHRKIHGFTCDKCGKTWISRAKYQKHIEQAHHGDSKSQRQRAATSATPDALPSTGMAEIFFECDQCKKTFNVHQEYINHLRRDHGPYRCAHPGCGKIFTTYNGLHHHKLKFHTNRKNFKCTLCNRIFKRKGSCVRHIKNSHEDALLLQAPDVLVQDVIPDQNFENLEIHQNEEITAFELPAVKPEILPNLDPNGTLTGGLGVKREYKYSLTRPNPFIKTTKKVVTTEGQIFDGFINDDEKDGSSDSDEEMYEGSLDAWHKRPIDTGFVPYLPPSLRKVEPASMMFQANQLP